MDNDRACHPLARHPPTPSLAGRVDLALLCGIWVTGRGGCAHALHIREWMQGTECQRARLGHGSGAGRRLSSSHGCVEGHRGRRGTGISTGEAVSILTAFSYIPWDYSSLWSHTRLRPAHQGPGFVWVTTTCNSNGKI